nr:MBL fold metallo-hydrolase [Mesorhizobium sp. WSM4875]
MRIFGKMPSPTQVGVLESLAPQVRRMVAGNSSVFTSTGTCTYVLGHGEVTVIDPGPANPDHIARLMAALEGERITRIIASHRHDDHSPGTRILQSICGAPIIGFDGSIFEQDSRVERPGPSAQEGIDTQFAPDVPIRDRCKLGGRDWEIEVLETRGHTADHLCFNLNDGQVLFTGDHIMEWAPSVIYPPEGDMGAYRESLQRIYHRPWKRFFPGHGGVIEEPSAFIAALLQHRRNRERRIVERILRGDTTIESIMQHLYQRIDQKLRNAASATVFAHLLDLARRELLVLVGRSYRNCVVESVSTSIQGGADVWTV